MKQAASLTIRAHFEKGRYVATSASRTATDISNGYNAAKKLARAFFGRECRLSGQQPNVWLAEPLPKE